MEKENRLDKFWQSIATLISPVIGLVASFLQIIDWLRDAEKMRHVSLALFLIALATALWVAQQAWEQKRGKRLVAILAPLFLICCGYAFLWGARIVPRPPGCWYHDLHITSPLDGSTVRADVVEVKGTLRGNPATGRVVVFVRSQDGALNWPHAPIEIDPILGVWKGSANVMAGNSPLTYRVAIAFVGKSGRALLKMYQKMGQDCHCWPGIEFLPDDIQMCDEVTITRVP